MIAGDDEQDRIWELLYARIKRVLQRYGTENHFGEVDYLLVNDNYGWKQHKIEIHKLHMLDPELVRSLQHLLREFPQWEIVIAVDVPGTENTWPDGADHTQARNHRWPATRILAGGVQGLRVRGKTARHGLRLSVRSE